MNYQDNDRTAQFSLAEIDSSHQREKDRFNVPINKSIKHNGEENINRIKYISFFKINDPEKEIHQSTMAIPEHCRPDTNNTLREQIEILLPFYALTDLVQHNDSTDAWICIFSSIYDITSLIKKTKGTEVYQLLIDYAGQDISFWFDERTYEPRKRIDLYTHESVLVIKSLSILEKFERPFWQTQDLLIGRLIEHPRYIRLIHHFLPKQSYKLEVDENETVGQIAKKFLKYNSHIFSYIWQYDGKRLDFHKTLTENGIPNEELSDEYYPTILLYFSDDLTIA